MPIRMHLQRRVFIGYSNLQKQKREKGQKSKFYTI